jgi:hypothetical protein
MDPVSAALGILIAWAIIATGEWRYARRLLREERAAWAVREDKYIHQLAGVRTDPTPLPRYDRHWNDRKEAAVARERQESEVDAVKRAIREGNGR